MNEQRMEVTQTPAKTFKWKKTLTEEPSWLPQSRKEDQERGKEPTDPTHTQPQRCGEDVLLGMGVLSTGVTHSGCWVGRRWWEGKGR